MVTARRNADGAQAAAPPGSFALLEPADWRELAPLLAARAQPQFEPGPARPDRAGEAPSRLAGRGQDYAQSRPYQAGDDMRFMHWALLARTGRPYVRVFEQERRLAWHALVDVHGSMLFGTRARTKAAQAARSALAGAARQVSRWPLSRVEASLWTPLGVQTRSFGSGHAAVRSLAAWLAGQRIVPPCAATAAQRARAAEVSRTALESWAAIMRRASVQPTQMLLCSDFDWLDARAGACLAGLADEARMAAVEVFDPAEAALPELPPARFADGTSGATGWLAPGRSAREAFAREALARRERLQRRLRALRMASVRSCTTDSAARIQALLAGLDS
ncbi:DUF58 domain-containing protein [Thiomonas sp. FB-6]|uniref:DUF58 domain-containing protein n=1 Tax=Thiomonas sp. FB-6 TaxID=1158291 RepID=UPI000376A3C4|nr:DUF58 domain-containing protein [Thiomonas sp. FB-6]